MKKLLLSLFLLTAMYSFGQKVGANVIKYKVISSTTRDTYTVPAGETWKIYNTTTGQWEKNIEGAGWVIDEGAGLLNIVEDITPQLGADLDLNAFDIVSTSGTSSIDVAHYGAQTRRGKLTFQTNDVFSINLTSSGGGTLPSSMIADWADGKWKIGGSNIALTGESQTLAIGVSDVTATAAEVNLLDLAGLTAGYVLSADTATTASWKAQTGGGSSLTANILALGADVADAAHDDKINTLNLTGTASIEIPLNATYAHAVGTILYYSVDSGESNIDIDPAGGVTYTATSIGGTTGNTFIAIYKTATDTWETITYNKNTIQSTVTGEPSGSDVVLNFVSLTQAEYDAGSPVSTTFYAVTDAKVTKYISIPFTTQGGDVATGTSLNSQPYPVAITITDVWATVLVAGTTSVITVDINEDDGTPATMLSTKITIDATERSSSTAAIPPVISDASFAAFSHFIVDVDTADSGDTGATGTVIIAYTED